MTYVIVAYWRPREGQTEKVEAILRLLQKQPMNLFLMKMNGCIMT